MSVVTTVRGLGFAGLTRVNAADALLHAGRDAVGAPAALAGLAAVANVAATATIPAAKEALRRSCDRRCQLTSRVICILAGRVNIYSGLIESCAPCWGGSRGTPVEAREPRVPARDCVSIVASAHGVRASGLDVGAEAGACDGPAPRGLALLSTGGVL